MPLTILPTYALSLCLLAGTPCDEQPWSAWDQVNRLIGAAHVETTADAVGAGAPGDGVPAAPPASVAGAKWERLLDGGERTPGADDGDAEARAGWPSARQLLPWSTQSHTQRAALGRVEYGFQYQTPPWRWERWTASGDRKEENKAEMWSGVRWGRTRLRTTMAEVWNNLDEQPNRPRTTKSRAGVGLDFTLTDSSYAGIFYDRGVARTSFDFLERLGPRSTRPMAALARASDASLHSIGGWYYTGTKTWNVSLGSTHSSVRDAAQPAAVTASTTADASLTYMWSPRTTLTPALSLWQDRSRWTNQSSQAGTASLTLGYGPLWDRLHFSTYHSYYAGRGSYGPASGLNLAGSVSAQFAKPRFGVAALFVELDYGRYTERLYTDNSVSGFIRALIPIPNSLG